MENIHVVAPQDAAFASDDLEAVRAFFEKQPN